MRHLRDLQESIRRQAKSPFMTFGEAQDRFFTRTNSFNSQNNKHAFARQPLALFISTFYPCLILSAAHNYSVLACKLLSAVTDLLQNAFSTMSSITQCGLFTNTNATPTNNTEIELNSLPSQTAG